MARSVSMWGPNAQGVRSRPDRSVALGDVREQPVQTMGIDLEGARAYLEWSRKNPRPRGPRGEPADPNTMPEAARRWIDKQTAGWWEDDLNEPIRDEIDDEAKAQINVGDAELEWDDPLLEVERDSLAWERFREDVVGIETDRLDQQLEKTADEEASARAWEQAGDDASVGDPEWDGFPAEMRGLSGEERALTGQTGGFAPSPPMSGSLPNRSTNLPAGSPGFDARSPELLRALQASSQRVNPQQEVFPGMGGWQEQLAEARQKLKEAERREAERAAARRLGRPIPKGPPIPGNQNPESGAASQFAPSGQLPVDPTAFRAPQGQTMDWFNNLSTEQKVGMALMLMSGGMAAGGGAAAAGGGAALRGGAALLPLILNQ